MIRQRRPPQTIRAGTLSTSHRATTVSNFVCTASPNLEDNFEPERYAEAPAPASSRSPYGLGSASSGNRATAALTPNVAHEHIEVRVSAGTEPLTWLRCLRLLALTL